jgi:hypothetical protein
MSDELTPTLGAQWRKEREEGVLVRLPNGDKLVRIRKVRPDMLLRRGRIPDTLTTLMLNMLYGRLQPNELEDFLSPREQAEEALEMLESLRAVCEAALVEPRIVDEPIADDEISIDDLEIPDRGRIFSLVFMPADALSRFRYQPKTNVDAVENVAGDTQQAV